MKLLSKIGSLATATALTFGGTLLLHKQAVAQSFDIACKVILCLAGGFPSGCGDAFSYMKDRLTQWPPLPPFGFCALSNGQEYDNHNVDFSFLGGRDSYVCPKSSPNLFIREDDESGDLQEVFCYTSVEIDDDGETSNTTFFGKAEADQFNYRIQITLEGGTESEFVSPTYLGDFSGRFVERDS